MVNVRRARAPLKGILTPEQQQRGYRLYESEDLVELYHLGECIAVFSSSGAKPWKIREAADQHWAKVSTQSPTHSP